MTMQQEVTSQTTELENFDPVEEILGGYVGERRAQQVEDADLEPADDELEEGAEDLDEEPTEEQAEEAADESKAESNLPLDDPKALGALLATTPANWKRIPTRLRTAAIEEALGHAVAYGQNLGRQEMQGRVQESSQVAALVAEKDALAASDPDGFADWAEANPGDAARYYGAKAQGRAASDPALQAQQAVLQAAQEITAPLRDYPAAVAAIRAKMEAGEYPSTSTGLFKLSRDVGLELAKAEAAKAAADAAAAERSKAAARRRGLARPVVASGGPGSRATSLENLDPIALAMDGFREERTRR